MIYFLKHGINRQLFLWLCSDKIYEKDLEKFIQLSKKLHRVYSWFQLWRLCLFKWKWQDNKQVSWSFHWQQTYKHLYNGTQIFFEKYFNKNANDICWKYDYYMDEKKRFHCFKIGKREKVCLDELILNTTWIIMIIQGFVMSFLNVHNWSLIYWIM